MGIDGAGKLKKLVGNGPAVPSVWENVLTESVGLSDELRPARFVRIASNEHSILALDEDGNLFVPPTKMEQAEANFVDVSCGKEHFMALTKDGSVFTWGSGRS